MWILDVYSQSSASKQKKERAEKELRSSTDFKSILTKRITNKQN
jgi:hypothetical protein